MTIIICAKCNGTGVIQCDEIIDYHHNDKREWFESCSHCKGSGRMVATTTLKAYEPEILGDKAKEML